ncbi:MULTISPECIES: porin family protein [Niastella]|uniref:Outer membrane beta-barrel protein n=1 Tax=Niastella soli TaxID=2821487 RepID=A0ABS3Z4K6_9BACT|nr:outer membrane beta-barrel protein [Niastella soli]MBO9205103.1 outer membrane beta-barrel protein [Niastella soli]
MYPLDDDNLDRLSREAAEGFEVGASASGWDHLEQRLDIEMPKEKKRRRFLFWLFLITATTGGALTGILKYHPATPIAKNVSSAFPAADNTSPLPENQTGNTRTTNTNQHEAVTGTHETPVTTAPYSGKQPIGSNQATIAPATTTTKPGINTSKPGINQGVAAPVTASNKPSTQPVEKPTSQKGSKPGRVRIQKAPATLNYAVMAPVIGTSRSNKPAKQKPGRRSSNTTSNQNKQAEPTVSANNSPTLAPENRLTTVDKTTNDEVVTANPTTGAHTDSVKKTVAASAGDSTKPVAQQKKKDKIQQPLEIGAIVGPDMSAVAFGPLYKPGYNFGLQIGYRFSDRWSVNTGVIYTKKFYKTDSSHFKYKDYSMPNMKTVSSVEGNCSMWEIPVNVRYDFSFNEKRRWFASTGLSTYLMDKEDYDVYYRWNGGPTYPQDLYNDTNSNYFFSILNLSVGMERSLGKRFSVQAEPYLKIPLTGLGKGEMRMNSYGILFALKYKPFFNKKRSDNK